MLAALGDANPGVRRHAIRLSEAFLTTSSEMGPALAGPDRRRRRAGPPATGVQSRTVAGRADRTRPGAAGQARPGRSLSDGCGPEQPGPRQHCPGPSATVFADRQDDPPLPLSPRLLALAVALNQTVALPAAVARVAAPRDGHYADWQMTSLAELLAALARSGEKIERLTDLGIAEPIERMLADAQRIAGDQQATEPQRLAAIGALGRDCAAGAGRDHRCWRHCWFPKTVQPCSPRRLPRWVEFRIHASPTTCLAVGRPIRPRCGPTCWHCC